MKRGYILVEGRGEVGAVDNLIARLWQEAERWHPWAKALRWVNLHQAQGIEKGIGYVRAQGDAGALLIIRDEDDACPRDRAPAISTHVQRLAPPFPVAIVLMYREYEVLFLPCLEQMAGRPIVGSDGQEREGFVPGTKYEGDWEAKRGVKQWLSEQLPPGRSYKPTVDQLPLTRMMDLAILRAAAVPCFGTLERALAFLHENYGNGGRVYPPPRA